VYVSDYRIHSLDGLYGIVILNYASSIIITVFIVLLIINAYNFIDGIDLQASFIAIAFLVPIGIWFFINHQDDYAILSLCLSASLLAFAKYNYPPSKIFLGDAGTMIIGLIIAFVTIRFINLNANTDIKIPISHSSVVILGTFSIFILDVFRVAFTRIYKGNSPLKADKNHLHHLMLKLGWSQKKIAITNTVLLFLMMLLNIGLQQFNFEPNVQLAINIFIVSLLFVIIIRKIKAQKKLPIVE
jgi:UDP-GlcNAc:undecaprenyl-phosphate GlcNAc-1-phosphate transferase